MKGTVELFAVMLVITVVAVAFLGHFDLDHGVSLYGTEDKGAWSSETTYVKGDIVQNDGKTFQCVKTSLNNEPVYLFWGITINYGYWNFIGTNEELAVTDTNTSIWNSLGKGISLYGRIMAFNVVGLPEGFTYVFWIISALDVWAIICFVRGLS